MKRIRLVLWAAVALAFAGLGALLIRGEAPSAAQQPASLAKLGGPFTLVGTDGKPFSSAQLSGKPYAIFFGFTHCPDVCPNTLARLVRLRQQLDSAGKPLAIVFVSVDPERDSAQALGRYTQMFNSPIIGLTGSEAQIEQVKKQFAVYSREVTNDAAAMIDHSATVLLFDAAGEFAGTISPQEGEDPALAKLKRITA